MTDIEQIETDLMNRVATTADEAGLEALRVAALGKSGTISLLLASLGKLQPDSARRLARPIMRCATVCRAHLPAARILWVLPPWRPALPARPWM